MLVNVFKGREATRNDLLADLVGQGIELNDAAELLDELIHARLIVSDQARPEPLAEPPSDFPLQTLVLNLTKQCNLSRQSCYEFGADKVATPQGKPKFMDLDTA